MNNDLISREALKEDIENSIGYSLSYEALLNAIDNAPTVEEKPTGDLANEVWKLYKKYQPYLATRVIEFGDELKDLLGKYQKKGGD